MGQWHEDAEVIVGFRPPRHVPGLSDHERERRLREVNVSKPEEAWTPQKVGRHVDAAGKVLPCCDKRRMAPHERYPLAFEHMSTHHGWTAEQYDVWSLGGEKGGG